MTAACIWLVLTKITEIRPETRILKIQEKIQSEGEKSEIVIPDIVQKINARNANIGTFLAENMEVKIWERNMRFKLRGELFYKKDAFFRMKISSILGKEVDLGANDQVFWYWSRRDPQPGLYYARYEDYASTRLKTPFNPVFLRESLGLSQIETNNAQFISKDGFTSVSRVIINALGNQVIYSIFINEQLQRIEGCLITDLQYKPLASCEIQKFSGDLPQRILFVWHEEDKVMLLEFDDPKVNVEIDDSQWELPRHEPKINMAEEMVAFPANLNSESLSETREETAK